MSVRQIRGLKWAQQLAGRPKCIPACRPRGAKAEGLRYERSLARRLPLADHGKWFQFEDAAGPGFCQPDLLVTLPGGRVAILEVKYSWVPEAHLQVSGLYVPVVERALGVEALPVVVVKRLTEGMRGTSVTGDLWHACQLAAAGFRPVFHWLGKASVMSPAMLDLEAA